MEPKEFGDYLRVLREKQRLSATRAARLAGISPAYLWQIEKGTRSPSPEILKKLAPVYEVSVQELMKAIGYLDEPELGDRELERIEWAFKLATTDPEGEFSAQIAPLLPAEVDVQVKKAIVAAYELVSGKKLL